MAWTYNDLRSKPLAAFVTPRADWQVHLKPEVDGHPFACSRWTRAEGWMPVLENTYEYGRTSVDNGKIAAVVKMPSCNPPKRYSCTCATPSPRR